MRCKKEARRDCNHGRATLRDARAKSGMTQQQVADALGISLRYYCHIEAGTRTGDFEIWDQLEDMFGVHQRELREVDRSVFPKTRSD